MRPTRSWFGNAWGDLAGEPRSHRRERNPKDAPMRRGVPFRNARSPAHRDRRGHGHQKSRGAVSDPYYAWWKEGLDSAGSDAGCGQGPVGEEGGSGVGARVHLEHATRRIRRVRLNPVGSNHHRGRAAFATLTSVRAKSRPLNNNASFFSFASA